jgi:antitoxin YefM
MSTISLTEARNRLPELVDDVSNRRSEYVITEHGRALAVLISADEHDALVSTLEVLSDSTRLTRIQRGLEEIAARETVSFEDAFGEPL